jgi:hypothetical protein
MWAKFMSAWLCAPAGTADKVAVVEGATDDVASLVAALLHAPMTAIAANAATPVATVLVLFTKDPFVETTRSVYVSLPSLIGRDRDCPSRSVKIR